MNDFADDHALLCTAVREAGGIAMRYFRGDLEHWHKAPGDPVSEADHAIDAFLRERLCAARPDYGWLSEETEDDPVRLERVRVWVVDPIDGTRAYIEGRAEFTVAAALVADGRPVAAAVYNPATEEFFEARRGAGARLNGEPIAAGEETAFEGARLLAGRRMFERLGWTPPHDLHFGSVNSIAYRMCLVASGQYDGCVSLAAKSDWDIAAAELVLSEAGGRATDSHGQDFRYNERSTRHRSVIAAGRPMHARLMAILDTADRPAGVAW